MKFPDLVPAKPYCTDTIGVTYIRPASVALQCPYIQLNGPILYVWMTFDIDRHDARKAAADVAQPNFIAVNSANGHAHLGYLLGTPVLKNAGAKPLAFAADIEHGLLRRLGADPAYSGTLTKNPLHDAWAVEWLAPTPYALSELASTLTRTSRGSPPFNLRALTKDGILQVQSRGSFKASARQHTIEGRSSHLASSCSR